MRTPRFWQHKKCLSTALLPLSALYAFGARWDRTHTTLQRAPITVISIGNATAGGAGKTPTTLALATLLRSMGQTPHIISRGYGGAVKTTHRVHANDGWRQVGDEALLLANAAPTWVGRDRLASAHAAQHAGASLVLADDALQHHALQKDLSFLVIDGAYGFGNGRLLPAGPLREPLHEALARCHAAIIIGNDVHGLAPHLAPLPVFHALLTPQGDVASLRDARLVAFAGIAHPSKFYATLRALGANLVATQDFPDHHPYQPAQLERLAEMATQQRAQLITTTKDAVKIPAALRGQIRILDVTLDFSDPAALQAWLAARL